MLFMGKSTISMGYFSWVNHGKSTRSPGPHLLVVFFGPRPWETMALRRSAMCSSTAWIGFLGKIETGKPWVFTIKLFGLSGFNFPIIQFYEK